jgi:uncharacterized repeat protein (TIGR01451 family)
MHMPQSSFRAQFFLLFCTLCCLGSVILGTTVYAAGDEPTVDGLLDAQYLFLKNMQLTEDVNGVLYAPGALYGYEGSNVCYWAFVVDRTHNGNVYAETNATYLAQDGWTQKHNFGHLEQSDHATFVIEYGDGQSFEIHLNYLNVRLNATGQQEGPFRRFNYVQPPSAESGVIDDKYPYSDTQPSLISPHLSEAATSLYWNLFNSGWQQSGGITDISVFIQQSPPFDYNDAREHYWEWQMIYEWSIAKSEMGGVCGEIREELAGAHNSPSKVAGIATLGTIGNYVWRDADGDGIQNNATPDDPASGVGNVTVFLHDANTDAILRTTQTAPAGDYLFSNVLPGTYYIEYVLPDSYVFTVPDQGGDDALDSDANQTDGRTPVFTLNAGDSNLTLDAGVVADEALLGDYVWLDTNRDGLQGDTEVGIAGVTVNLLAGNNVISTTTTDDTGHYLFAHLQPGRYMVEFEPLADYTFTTVDVQDNSQDTLDSDARTPAVMTAVSDGGVEPQVGDILTYTVDYTNTSDFLPIANLVFSVSVPIGTSYIQTSNPNTWSCAGGATGTSTVCSYRLENIAAGSTGKIQFTVKLGPDDKSVPEILRFVFGASSSARSQSSGTTLEAGEEDRSIDAGMMTMAEVATTVFTPRNTTPTGSDPGTQPFAANLYLPDVQD